MLRPILCLLTFTLPVNAWGTDMQTWLTSDARAELIAEFEASDCRLLLADVADLLFDHDVSEEFIYAERLILMEPESPPLSFPVVLIKGAQCRDHQPNPIKVPTGAITQANAALLANDCVMDVSALETLEYRQLVTSLTDSDRRNVVSELYNRGLILFRFAMNKGVATLRAHKINIGCQDQPYPAKND